MDDKKQLYTIKWTQLYNEWEVLAESVIEMQLENNNFLEAQTVIKHIMDMK